MISARTITSASRFVSTLRLFKFISAKMTTSPEFLATVQDDDGQDAQKYGVYQGAFSVQVII
ncbi:hypothetical protein WP50_16100 [Lactiplantibacillus plantarum]|nr:hypothetical protein WP50_16100 [Lactiplantibacillus plantarum]